MVFFQFFFFFFCEFENRHLHFPHSTSLEHMVDRVYDIIIYTIQAISIIKVLGRLTHAMVSQIRLGVDLGIHLIVRTPPVSDFHFVVGIIGSCVEQDDISRLV